jgi:uncharacterized damage-inducible protein DinB
MFRRIADFEKAWQGEMESTMKVLSRLTDQSLGQRVTPDGRSLGFLGWHIAGSIPEMMNRTGLAVTGPEHGPAPATAAEILKGYEQAARSLLDEVKARWTDASLDQEDEMYGERWARGFTLYALCVHEAHHRGQMTVLMRQADLKVPGVYGPAREEWAAMGMAPLE